MSKNLIITLIFASLFIFILASRYLRKGRIPEKYALLWYLFAFIILIVSLFPNILSFLARTLGFQLVSNMIIVLLIGILFLLVMALTIMIAGQKKKTTLLIQEVSILKNEINNLKEKKK